MHFTENPDLHRKWQVEMKGQKLVDELKILSGMYKKKDREMDYLYWSQRLKELGGKDEKIY